MYFQFIKHKRIFYAISALLAVGSLASILVFGLNLGIEFTGGAVLEVNFQQPTPNLSEIRAALSELELGGFSLQKQASYGLLIKMQNADQTLAPLVLEKLKSLGQIEEGSESFELIGSVVGKELKKKTNIVVILALLAILCYIALSFRRVSKPVRSYVYGLTSLIALGHDVIIPLGVFSLLGHFYGLEITIPIITALLTVFGYSINDSVVVFDRVRENLLKQGAVSFETAVEQSLNQTLKRSLHTSLTTLIALTAVFFLGGESLRQFALALILGITAGTYSSIFLATPLLTSYLKLKERKYRTG